MGEVGQVLADVARGQRHRGPGGLRQPDTRTADADLSIVDDGLDAGEVQRRRDVLAAHRQAAQVQGVGVHPERTRVGGDGRSRGGPDGVAAEERGDREVIADRAAALAFLRPVIADRRRGSGLKQGPGKQREGACVRHPAGHDVRSFAVLEPARAGPGEQFVLADVRDLQGDELDGFDAMLLRGILALDAVAAGGLQAGVILEPRHLRADVIADAGVEPYVFRHRLREAGDGQGGQRPCEISAHRLKFTPRGQL